MLVEDDDVGAQPLQPPVLLRLQHLAHERHVVVADDADEQDRQVAGDRVRPQPGLAELVRRRSCRRAARSEPSVPSTRDARRSNSTRVVGRDAQMAQAALRVRERQREGARGGARDRGTSARAPRPSRDRDAMPVANESRTVAPGGSRIRWRRLTIGSSTTPVVPDSARPSSASGSRGRRGRGRGSARDRSPIRAGPAAGPRGSGRGTPTPPASPRIARPPMAEQRRAVGQVLGFDEQLAERRVREVVRRRTSGRSRRSW